MNRLTSYSIGLSFAIIYLVSFSCSNPLSKTIVEPTSIGIGKGKTLTIEATISNDRYKGVKIQKLYDKLINKEAGISLILTNTEGRKGYVAISYLKESALVSGDIIKYTGSIKGFPKNATRYLSNIGKDPKEISNYDLIDFSDLSAQPIEKASLQLEIKDDLLSILNKNQTEFYFKDFD